MVYRGYLPYGKELGIKILKPSEDVLDENGRNLFLSVNCHTDGQGYLACSLDDGKGEKIGRWWCDPGFKVHRGAASDFCGMYLIVGDRYRCMDCKEMIGFDLCGEYYNTRSKRPGRFNQQHTPEHKFELV
ncbi:unnamed protein product [Lupinus luteus]|uniref:Uncharacterized protein n=1 Tax=Lupinus luteus TaxID=3873 RepID=A0AAV1VRA2_LUPLU